MAGWAAADDRGYAGEGGGARAEEAKAGRWRRRWRRRWVAVVAAVKVVKCR